VVPGGGAEPEDWAGAEVVVVWVWAVVVAEPEAVVIVAMSGREDGTGIKGEATGVSRIAKRRLSLSWSTGSSEPVVLFSDGVLDSSSGSGSRINSGVGSVTTGTSNSEISGRSAPRCG